VRKKTTATEMKPKLGAVAKAFQDSESEEEEEMPAEAKQRMRNIGKYGTGWVGFVDHPGGCGQAIGLIFHWLCRGTPTSSGPRSFNKSKTGFSNVAGEWSAAQRLVLGPNKPENK
jgi:hypothetical protein